MFGLTRGLLNSCAALVLEADVIRGASVLLAFHIDPGTHPALWASESHLNAQGFDSLRRFRDTRQAACSNTSRSLEKVEITKWKYTEKTSEQKTIYRIIYSGSLGLSGKTVNR